MKFLLAAVLILCALTLLCDAGEGKKAKKIAKAVAKGAAAMAGRKSNRFFSAWTIISLVMLFIIGGVAAYYIHMFYPLVCAKRGKYDVMEMAHV